jgi:hypothetical protein
MTTRPCVYRHYDVEGRLLYVGATQDIKKRDEGHRYASPWAKDVARTEIIYFETWGNYLRGRVRSGQTCPGQCKISHRASSRSAFRRCFHLQFKHPQRSGRVTVPRHSGDISYETLRSIEKQSGLRLRK